MKILIKKDKYKILTTIDKLEYKNNKIYYKWKEYTNLTKFINFLIKKKLNDNIEYKEFVIEPIEEMNSYLQYYYDYWIIYEDNIVFVHVWYTKEKKK